MALPEPTFASLHAVMQFATIGGATPDRDEALVDALAPEFPNVVQRVAVPPGSPPSTPSLVVASTSSQLVVSAAQADFHVRFYGPYVEDLNRGLEYVESKLQRALHAFEVVGRPVQMMGLIGKVHFSFKGVEGESPAEHILATHLATNVASSDVHDVNARVALRVRDTYFVSLAIGNYELRVVEQPVIPGMQFVRLSAGEGRVEDFGIELTVDVNNNLELQIGSTRPTVTDRGLEAMTGILREVVTNVGPTFVRTGEISAADVVGSSLQ